MCHALDDCIGKHRSLADVHQIAAIRLHIDIYRHQHCVQLHFHGKSYKFAPTNQKQDIDCLVLLINVYNIFLRLVKIKVSF